MLMRLASMSDTGMTPGNDDTGGVCRTARTIGSDRGTRSARGTRRGLGLLDAMMALVVLTVIGIMAGNVVEAWVAQQISQAEARALSAWADAGELSVLRERRRLPSGTLANIGVLIQPPRAFADARTPHRRRAITVWAWVRGSGDNLRADIFAVARQADQARPVPQPLPGDGIAGVGMIATAPGSTEVSGPAMTYDLQRFIRRVPYLAGPGDMVALRQVALGRAASPYLHRITVDGRPELNAMQTHLHMGGNAITGAARIETDRIVTHHVDGPLTVGGNLAVTGSLHVRRPEDGTNPGGTDEDGTSGGRVRLEVDDVTLTGILETDTLSARRVRAETINADNAVVKSLLVTGGCAGCR